MVVGNEIQKDFRYLIFIALQYCKKCLPGAICLPIMTNHFVKMSVTWPRYTGWLIAIERVSFNIRLYVTLRFYRAACNADAV